MIRITSSQNRVIKEIRSLKRKEGREEKGLFFVEGVRIVEEAFNSSAAIIYTVMSEEYAEDMEKCSGCGRKLFPAGMDTASFTNYIIPDGLFREVADTESPQGILAVIRNDCPNFTDASLKNGQIILLDSVRDPGNMGAIIRTADAAGFTGVVTSGSCVDAYNPKVLRSTMGSIFHIPVYSFGSTTDAIRLIKSKGFRVYASYLEGAQSIYDMDMSIPVALVIGSEADGISMEAAGLADALVSIPMAGRAESLNASVAAGIMMFEAVRQRQYGINNIPIGRSNGRPMPVTGDQWSPLRHPEL